MTDSGTEQHTADGQMTLGRWARVHLRGWLVVILVVLAIRWAWLEPRRIPSASMEPTLQGTDDGWRSWWTSHRVAVDKFIYGPRFPLNRVRIPFTNTLIHYADRRLYTRDQPARWDMVVFKGVDEENPGEVMIKRVVGLPGEEVRIADGHVHIDGEPIEPPEPLRDILHYTTAPDDGAIRRFIVQMGQLPEPPPILNPRHVNSSKLIAHLDAIRPYAAEVNLSSASDETIAAIVGDIEPGAFQVARELLDMHHEAAGTFRYGILPDEAYRQIPAKAYFLLGDNSGQSRDGRAFGWIPEEHIIGRAFCIWWPLDRRRDFTGFTRTWYGIGLLVGIPLVAVLYEILSRFVVQSLPVSRSEGGTRLRRGDHALVDRRAYGWRLPFTSRRVGRKRLPERGALVAYRMPNREVAYGYVAGLPGDTVKASKGGIAVAGQIWPGPNRLDESGNDLPNNEMRQAPDGHVLILSKGNEPSPDGRRFGWTPLHRVVGPVIAVWWPFWRARRVDAVKTGHGRQEA